MNATFLHSDMTHRCGLADVRGGQRRGRPLSSLRHISQDGQPRRLVTCCDDYCGGLSQRKTQETRTQVENISGNVCDDCAYKKIGGTTLQTPRLVFRVVLTYLRHIPSVVGNVCSLEVWLATAWFMDPRHHWLCREYRALRERGKFNDQRLGLDQWVCTANRQTSGKCKYGLLGSAIATLAARSLAKHF